MSEYSIELSNLVSPNTEISVYELCKNGESLIELFAKSLEKDVKLFNQFSGAISIVERSASFSRPLPKTKFRQIEGLNLACKVYEAKKGKIRIYLFHQEKTGRIIVTGGKKGNQKKDIKAVAKTIKEFQENT